MNKQLVGSDWYQRYRRGLAAGLDATRRFMGKPMALWLILGLFVVQAGVLVFVVDIYTPPDELNNVQFIEYYANHSLNPVFTKQTPTYDLGDKTREVDYLYHYTMSLVVRALPLSSTTDHHVIRLFSVVTGLLSFLVLARVLKRLGVPAAVTASCILIITNLPMVLLLSAAINNDVFVWLGTALGFLLILRLLDKPTALDFVWLVALCSLGGLVKRTLLPFSVFIGIWGLLIVVRNWRKIRIRSEVKHWYFIVAVLIALLGIGLFAERVGGNIVRYGSIQVTCEQVNGDGACYDFWTNVRARSLTLLPHQTPVPLPAFVLHWFSDSFFNIVDIQSQFWHHAVRPARIVTPLLVAALVSGLAYGGWYEKRRFIRDELSRRRTYVMGISLACVLVQLVVNYSTYNHYHVYGIALNGRYIIPCLLPLIGLAGFYWSQMLGRHPRVLSALVVILVVVTIGGSGLLMMLRNSQLHTGI